MTTPYDLPGFGDFLTDAGLKPKYREHLRQLGETNYLNADLPRFVTIWREEPDSGQRGRWTARQVESWIETKSQQTADFEDFQVVAGAFFRERLA